MAGEAAGLNVVIRNLGENGHGAANGHANGYANASSGGSGAGGGSGASRSQRAATPGHSGLVSRG